MRKTLFLGTILFLIALGLRLLPLNYGLPNTFYYDEGRYVSQAVRVGSDGIRPASYTYGPLFPYAVAGSYGFVYSIGKASGQWLDSTEFQKQYFKDPSLFFGTARALSALFGALAATLLLTTGRRWLRLETGRVANSWENFLEPLKSSANLGPWLAAFSLAVFATAVSFGAQAKAESLLLLLIVLWLYGVGRYRQGSSLAILSFAGICVGLATATKYNAILFLPWHALVPFLGSRFRKGSTWLATLLAPVGGFFLGAPASILDLQGLWQGIQFNSKISTGFSFADPTVWASKMQSFAFEDLQGGLGPLLFLFALMGTWSVLRNRGRSGLWLVSLAWGFLAFHLFQDAPRLVPRYLLPAIPVFFILAGAGIDSVLGATVHRFGSPPAFLRVATVVLLLLPTLIGTVSWVTPVLGDDTRWQAQVWIEKNIPSQSAVLVEDPVASPPLNPTGAA
ncbi:MAG: hypothetical protein HKN21_08605, partial [Candidatus Eisenbacteria bacterium]|nr:hypothetical protein [Candidatus Eisenbacteria bacterium]